MVTQTESIVHIVHQVLGADVVGMYLHGSAVLDGLRPSSDVDVLVVARRHTSADERRALVDELLQISGTKARGGPARPVELTIVVQSEVRPWRYPPNSEFQYGEWLRAEYERGETPSPAPSPDLAPLITMVLLGNSSLSGPPPAAVLDPVPPEDLARAIVAGVIRSKDAAAAWVLTRLPADHRPVLAHARAVYAGDDDENWDGLLPRVRQCADYIVGAIGRLAAQRGIRP